MTDEKVIEFLVHRFDLHVGITNTLLHTYRQNGTAAACRLVEQHCPFSVASGRAQQVLLEFLREEGQMSVNNIPDVVYAKFFEGNFNQKEETTMTQDNVSFELLNALQSDYTTIQVGFTEHKSYTYKVTNEFAAQLAVGQLVIVPVKDTYAVTTVTEIHTTPCQLPASIRYKWCTQKVDTTEQAAIVASEEAFLLQIEESARISRMNSLLTQLRSDFGDGTPQREKFEAVVRGLRAVGKPAQITSE